MTRGRSLPLLALTPAEREQLLAWSRSTKTSQSLALRARIVLACAAPTGNHDVATMLGVTPQTVGKWRTRFLQQRLDGLIDAPRPGAPRKRDEALVDRLVRLTLETQPPARRVHWSSRALASELGVSQSTVSRVWQSIGVQPRDESFRLSIDPGLVDQVREIVGLYIDPPMKLLALGVDERQPAPAPSPAPHGTLAAPLRAAVRPLRDTPRHFEALDEVACRRDPPPRPTSGTRALRRFVHTLHGAVPAGRSVRVVIDDMGRRSGAPIEQWLGAHAARYEVHVAPSCAAWVTQVQRWLQVLRERDAPPEEAAAMAHLEQALRGHFTPGPGPAPPFAWVKSP